NLDNKYFIRDGNGIPFIPGSSIKGAISTAIEYYKKWKIDDEKRKEAFRNVIIRDSYLNSNDLTMGKVIIGKMKRMFDIEVIKPGTKFKLEIEILSNSITINDIMVYSTLRNLKIIKLINDLGYFDKLPNEIRTYYNNFMSKFRSYNFDNPSYDKNMVDFVRQNGFIMRLGKYTGALSKVTGSFDRNYNYISLQRKFKYLGRLIKLGQSQNEVLMGYIVFKILS
ncbi:MAG: RAMP superfamily CRISPR-associated protein, partial [Nanopusillaceae archaeon]